MAPTRLIVRRDDEVHEVEVAPNGQVSVAGVSYRVRAVQRGLYRVEAGGQRWLVAAAGPAEACWVFVEGRAAVVEAAPAADRGGLRRRAAGHRPDAMSAPMPATVVKVLVEPGAQVAHGDTVLVLEAMKMELPIRAPRDGVVRELRCRAGDLVQPGVNLVELA